MTMLTMLSGMGNAEAACSSYVGTLVFNEVQQPNGGTTYLELRILNPNILAATNHFSGWKLSVNTKISGTTTSVTKNFDDIVTDTSLNTCGPNSAWIQIPDAAIDNAITNARGEGDINFVLYDASNNMIDLLRISNANNNTSMQSFYAGAGSQCASIEPSPVSTLNNRYDFRWGQGSSIKDWYRTTDGTGTWTGTINANNANSICGSNDVNSTAQVGLNKVAGTATVNTDTDFSFQLFAQNPSTGTGQSNVVVTDNLNNAGLSFVSCSPTAPDTCTHSGGVVTWTIASLPVNTVRSTLLTVKASTTGTKTNTITANSTGTPTATASVSVTNSVPTITTVAASSITSSGAVLNGTVNPRGAATTVSFGYGTSPSFYTSTCTPASNSFTGNTVQNFSCSLSGLTCGTTYYFRATGTNSAGTNNGSDMSFTPLCQIDTFNAFESITTANAVTGKIYTKLSGVPFSLDIVAVNGGTQAASFNDNVKLELLANTASVGSGYGVDSCPMASQLIQTIATAAITNGRSTIAFPAVAGAYRDVRVRATYSGITPALVACSTDSFAIRPASISLTSNAAITATPIGPTYTPTFKGGSPFNLLASSNVTGYETATLELDTGKLTSIPTLVRGDLLTNDVSPDTNKLKVNESLSNNASYGEVGFIQLELGAYRDAAFTTIDQSGDCISGSSSNALASGKYGCNVGTEAITLGRFIPHHFATATTPPMECPGTAPAFVCPDSNGTPANGMAYADQTFTASITARNASGGTTQNYDKDTGYANASGVAAYTEKGGASVPSGAASGSLSGNAVTANDFIRGKATLSTAKYIFTTPPGTASDIYLRASETSGDAVTSLRNPSSDSVEGGLKIAQGRLRLINAFGNGKQPLKMQAEVQFWSGTSWVRNNKDSTALTQSAIIVSDPAKLSITNFTFSNGSGEITLTATTAGSYDVSANLGATGAALASCTSGLSGGSAANVPWLRSRNGTCTASNSFAADPTARATFGVYAPETKKTIHVREFY